MPGSLMLFPTHPERAHERMLAATGDHRKRRLELRRCEMHEVVERADDLELAVEREKRLEQVLLVPDPPLVLEPLRRVVARREDVVHMDEDAARQLRQDVQEFELDVAHRPLRMRGVDEDDVSRGERPEYRWIGALDALAPHLDTELVEPWVLERLEADLPALILRVRRGRIGDREPRHERRLSAPDLDDPARLEMPDHRIERLGVTGPEPAVVVAEGPPTIAATFQRPQLGAVGELFEQRKLSVQVPVDARKRPRLVRVAKNIRRSVGRLVKM